MIDTHLLSPADLRAHLNVGKDRYKALLAAGMPAVILGGKEHRRHRLDRVLEWLETRGKPARRGRPHARSL